MRHQAEQGGMQLGAIVGKVKIALPGSGKDGSAIGKAQSGKMALGSFAHAGKIAELQMHVVEQISNEAFGNGECTCAGRGFTRRRLFVRCLACLDSKIAGLLDFKLRNHLRLAFVEDLKIFFMEGSNGVSLGVANHSPNYYQLDVNFECGRLILSRDLARTCLIFSLRSGSSGSRRRWGLAKSCRRAEKEQAAVQRAAKRMRGAILSP